MEVDFEVKGRNGKLLTRMGRRTLKTNQEISQELEAFSLLQWRKQFPKTLREMA
jgi:hypothetical protein